MTLLFVAKLVILEKADKQNKYIQRTSNFVSLKGFSTYICGVNRPLDSFSHRYKSKYDISLIKLKLYFESSEKTLNYFCNFLCSIQTQVLKRFVAHNPNSSSFFLG